MWDVASAVTSTVTSTVRQTAGEVIKSVQETDWKNEIADFSREVTVDAQTVRVRTAEAIGQLPMDFREHHQGDTQQVGEDGDVDGWTVSGLQVDRNWDAAACWTCCRHALPPALCTSTAYVTVCIARACWQLFDSILPFPANECSEVM